MVPPPSAMTMPVLRQLLVIPVSPVVPVPSLLGKNWTEDVKSSAFDPPRRTVTVHPPPLPGKLRTSKFTRGHPPLVQDPTALGGRYDGPLWRLKTWGVGLGTFTVSLAAPE